MSLSVKAYLRLQEGEEIRRFSVPHEASTSYAYFVEKVQRVYPQLLRQKFNLAWKDSDGEKVTFSSDEELTEALGSFEGDFFRVYIDGPILEAKKPAANGSGPEHPGVICDACDGKIKGTRFKCVTCPDFDLCSDCESQGFHSEHEMIRIRTPRTGPYHHGRRGHGRGGRGFGCGGPRGKGPWKHCRPPFHPHAFAHSFAFGPRFSPDGANGGNWTWPDASAWAGANDDDAHKSQPGPSNAAEGDGNEGAAQGNEQPPDMNEVFKALGDMMSSLFTNQFPQHAKGGTNQSGDANSNKDDAPPAADGPTATSAASSTKEQPTPTGSSSPSTLNPDFVMVDNNRAESSAPPQLTSDEIFQIRLHEATAQLEQMGFKNEGGWLTTLLIEKQCDVGKVLDTLQPASKK